MFELPGNARTVRRSSYYLCDDEQTVGLLGLLDADGVICGRIGNEEESLLDEEGIELYAGYYGDPDDALEFITGCGQ